MVGRERCPECGAPNPPPVKTCASETCDRQYRRSQGGRADAIYCSRLCAQAQAQRQYRRRAKTAT
jgi:hypothetical protein